MEPSIHDAPPLARRARATRVRYVVMAFLCVLSFLTYFDRVCIMRAQGDIERDLHLTDTQMGAIFGVFWFSYALFEIPGGWMGDRFGARSTLTRVVLAWSLFTALSGSAIGFVSLFTYRFLFGVGEAGGFPNMARVQSRWLPASAQGRASGTLWLVARWGGALSPLLFGTLLRGLDSHGFRTFVAHVPGLHVLAGVPAWRMGFWTCGVVGLVWVVLFFPWFRDNPADKASVNAAELELIGTGSRKESDRGHAKYDRGVWVALFTNPSLWLLALYYAFGSFTWSFFVSWVPKFLKQVHHLDYGKSEIMSGLPMFVGGIACLFGGTLSDRIIRATGRHRFGRAVLPTVGRLIAAGAIFGMRFTHTPTQAVVLMCITMLAHDLGQGASWATAIEIGGNYSGTAAGFINTVGNVGNMIQPIIGALIFTHFGWGTLFVVYGLAYFISAIMWLGIHPEKRFYTTLNAEL